MVNTKIDDRFFGLGKIHGIDRGQRMSRRDEGRCLEVLQLIHSPGGVDWTGSVKHCNV